MPKKVFQLLVLSLVMIFSCDSARDLDVDVSDVDVKQVNIRRYEKAIFSLSEHDSLKNNLQKLHKKFPFFIDEQIDSAELVSLRGYLNDPVNKDLYTAVKKKYSSLKGIENDLTEMFRHFKYYFSGFEPPAVYSYVSSLNHKMPIIYEDSVLVISLDMYLGRESRFYGMVGIPDYKSHWFQKSLIVPDATRTMIEGRIKKKSDPNLLDHMVYRGKILYLMDALMPNLAPKYKIKYTDQQMKWIRKNENFVWGLIVDKELLFSKDRPKTKNFINDGPFTSTISRQSPPRLADWLGWKMVQKYMDENKQVNMQELLRENDSMKILKKSKYKPARKAEENNS